MKTRNILIAIGAAALAAITTNAFAGNGALLSPRAAGNQIIHIAGTNSDPNLVAVGFTTPEYVAYLSPRAVGNQNTKAAGIANDVNPALQCVRMTASPKAIQACAANPAMPDCNTVTVAPLK